LSFSEKKTSSLLKEKIYKRENFSLLRRKGIASV